VSDKPKPGSPRDYRDPGAKALAETVKKTASLLIPGFKEFWAWAGQLIGAELEEDYAYLRQRVSLLEARQKFILDGPRFAKRAHQVFLMLARATQEEKRRYLCHGLLNIACGAAEEDDATLLLGLVEALSHRQIMILADLVDQMVVDQPDVPEFLRKDMCADAAWERLRERFPLPGESKEDARRMFNALVADLEGRGLFQKSWLAGDMWDNRLLEPSLLAQKLLAFIADPVALLGTGEGQSAAET
jgi:hypothetical protein